MVRFVTVLLASTALGVGASPAPRAEIKIDSVHPGVFEVDVDATTNMPPTDNDTIVSRMDPIPFMNTEDIVVIANRTKSDELPKTTDSSGAPGELILFPGSSNHLTGTTRRTTSSSGAAASNGDFLFPSDISVFGGDEEKEPGPALPPHRSVRPEGNCLQKHGLVMYEGTCERLLARNTCREGEWLVLVEGAPRCVQRPCPFGQLPFEGRCVDADDLSVCDRGQIMYVSAEGEVVCDCDNGFLYDSWSGNCYTRHERGACNFGQYLDLEASGRVTCVPNPCKTDEFVKDPETEICHRKMYGGFCDSVEIVFDNQNRTAECRALAPHNILDVPELRTCPKGSVRDYLNLCRKVFVTPTQFSYPVFKGKCPTGFIRDHLGICRTISSLFA